jgi:hypothetical protein
MTSKHPKLERPTDADLVRNPLIGGSKGVTMAQASLDDLEQLGGANTIEGDVENDTNAQGGIDKAEVMNRRRAPPRPDHAGRPRHPQKAKEPQLRALEHRPDMPDADEIAEEIERE